MPNQTHQFHLLNHLMVFSIILQFLYVYLLFWIYQHSQENLATTQKLFRNTSSHTFALWIPLKRASLTNLTQTMQIFFLVLFCFGKLMTAIDGIPSQTIALHIIQNLIPSKTKRDLKDGSEWATRCWRFLREWNQKRPQRWEWVSYTMLEVLERMKKKMKKET